MKEFNLRLPQKQLQNLKKKKEKKGFCQSANIVDSMRWLIMLRWLIYDPLLLDLYCLQIQLKVTYLHQSHLVVLTDFGGTFPHHIYPEISETHIMNRWMSSVLHFLTS